MTEDAVTLLEEASGDVTRDLGELSEMVQELLDLEDQVEELEIQLRARKEQLRAVSEGRIPEFMMSMNMAKIKLDSGESVEIKPFYNAKIPMEKQSDAYAWLASEGEDSIIKDTYNVALGKGEEELSRRTREALQSAGVWDHSKYSRGIHHSTLRAFVKNRIESGKPLPQDLFDVYVGKRATIRR